MALFADLSVAKKQKTPINIKRKRKCRRGEEVESLPYNMEGDVEEEIEEQGVKEEEAEEGQEIPKIRKSKRIGKGMANVIYPKKPKKKRDLQN